MQWNKQLQGYPPSPSQSCRLTLCSFCSASFSRRRQATSISMFRRSCRQCISRRSDSRNRSSARTLRNTDHTAHQLCWHSAQRICREFVPQEEHERLPCQILVISGLLLRRRLASLLQDQVFGKHCTHTAGQTHGHQLTCCTSFKIRGLSLCEEAEAARSPCSERSHLLISSSSFSRCPCSLRMALATSSHAADSTLSAFTPPPGCSAPSLKPVHPITPMLTLSLWGPFIKH